MRIWTSGIVTPVRDDDGVLLGFVKLLRDRTDLKTQLVAMQNRIVHQQQLDPRRMQSDRTFLHEHANVLHALTSAVELLSRTGGACEQVVEIMKRQIHSLERLAADPNDSVNRAEQPRWSLDSQDCDLSECLTTVADPLRRDAMNAGVILEALLPPGRIELQADPERLRQIFTTCSTMPSSTPRRVAQFG
ncbi:HAMP domain-containing histidine kinase [Aquincola tertiaricarbonis]|uniref:HAMP domain-containing histidine kinase n=1 Tax=Aquincola tertiaricarbonis TaxID=391953 RepID=UPI000614D95F|nr:HAMP domain-containing histidine kinase [Aquincola tertiaricarbonis]